MNEYTQQEIDRLIEELSSEISKCPFSTCFVAKDDLISIVYLLHYLKRIQQGE